MYLLLGAAGQPGDQYQDGDRVSASSGIASGTSSQPWLEDQDLSGSSCECDNSTSSRKSTKRSSLRTRRTNNNREETRWETKAQCHSESSRASPVSSRDSQGSPGLNTAYRAMVDLAANRTPSIDQSCRTETTDCPSDISVITSISCLPRLQPASSSPPSSSVSSAREDSLANRLGHVKEEESIQRLGGGQSRRGGGGEDRTRTSPPRQLFLPPTQLRAVVRDRLQAEGISLSSHPYTQSVGILPTLNTSFLFTPRQNLQPSISLVFTFGTYITLSVPFQVSPSELFPRYNQLTTLEIVRVQKN